MVQLCLFEPEIPQNVGTILRLGACLGIKVHIIEPCGFVWQDKNLKRAGMDYIDLANVIRHKSWAHFQAVAAENNHRLLFLDCGAEKSFLDETFSSTDILVAGRESNGFEGLAYDINTNSIKIPMEAGRRSLNVAVSLSMVTTEALRQTKSFP